MPSDNVALWTSLMLLPLDYSRTSIKDPETQALMQLVEFEHGSPTELRREVPRGKASPPQCSSRPQTALARTQAGPSSPPDTQGSPDHATKSKKILAHKFTTLGELALKV